MKKLRIAVMISGRGSNMGALARACMDPDYPAEIVLVLSNRPNVEGLELAREHGLPIRVIDHREFADRDAHDEVMSQALKDVRAELVCLAGYMRIVGDGLLTRWRGKMINMHPSLLPAFRGVDTHERAMDAGVRVHGCTVHYVSNELDAGPIIAQAVVPVHPKDDVDALADRVLDVEHVLYAQAVQLIAEGHVRFSGDDSVFDATVQTSDVLVMRAD